MFKAVVVCSGVIISASLSPFVVSAQTTGSDCVEIESDIARLECFDKAFSNTAAPVRSLTPFEAALKFTEFSPITGGISTDGVGNTGSDLKARATNVYPTEDVCKVNIVEGGFRPGFYHGTYLLEYTAYSIDLSKVQSYQRDYRVNGFAISMQRDATIAFDFKQFEGIGGNTFTMFGDQVGQQTPNSRSLQQRTLLVPFVSEPEDVPMGAEHFSQWIDACTGN